MKFPGTGNQGPRAHFQLLPAAGCAITLLFATAKESREAVRHILVIQNGEALPENLREVLAAPDIREVRRRNPAEAASALERNAFSAAVVYADGGATSIGKHLRSLRQLAPELSVVVIGPGEDNDTLEAAAFEGGADLFFAEPVPKRSLEKLIRGMAPQPSSRAPDIPPENAPGAASNSRADAAPAVSALQILRDFSNVLGFSLDYKAFTHHFALKLRDHISFSRIAIFLEQDAQDSFAQKATPRTMDCVASFGLPADLVDCFQLSRETGLGRTLIDNPRILHLSEETPMGRFEPDANTRKEFAILGCRVAIPITDRERAIGVAVLNGPVTGRGYSDDELQLLYLLMEELGLAIRNSRLHHELASHGKLIESVLGSMASGALVVSEDLSILYTNESARSFLGLPASEAEAAEWADLPARLAGVVHRAVEKGELPEPFLFPAEESDALFRISIIPFSAERELMLLPRPVMVMIEDFAKIEANKQNALRDSRAELIHTIAERFAHEIRNSLVPLTTHLQLIDKKIGQPAFQTSLKSALARETGRIQRFSDQMLYLAQNSNPSQEDIRLENVIREAFDRARAHAPGTQLELRLDNPVSNALIHGNEPAVVYAFEELFLNAMQAAGTETEGSVDVSIAASDEGILTITIKDPGPGFPADKAEASFQPFYTTRNTGVGLGLSVAKKIIEEHSGFVRANDRQDSSDWDVRVELPSNLTQPTQLK